MIKIGHLISKRKASRDSIIIRLKMLGWTQQEIADQVVKAGYELSYSQNAVKDRLKEFLKLKKHLNPVV